MNRALRWAVYLLVSLPVAVSQDTSVAPKQDNLYAAALFASLRQMDKEWGRSNKTPENSISPDYHHMIVKRSEMTERLPDHSGDYQVEVLDARELAERYRNLGKSFAILVFHPLKNEGAALTINIKVFWFSHKKTSSSYVFANSSDVEFRYDCAKQDWVVSKVKLGRM